MEQFKYKAFITYRHVSFDSKVAEKLQKLLETLPLPKQLREKHSDETKWRLFRDVTELPTSSDLGNDIDDALRNSEYLICICTPRYLESRWCMEEIARFKALHNGSIRNIIPVLAEGDPADSFPKALLYDDELGQEVEPLAANIAAPAEKEAMKKLRVEYLRIAARMLRCEFNDLYRRQERRERRRNRIISGAALGTLSVIAGISIAYSMNLSRKNDQISRQNVMLEDNRAEIEKQNKELIYNQEKIEQQNTELIENQEKIERQNTELKIENSEHLSVESKQQFANREYISSVRTALKALPSEEDEKPVLPEAENILSRELFALCENSFVPRRELVHDTAVKQVVCTEAGTVITLDSRSVYVWDTESGELLHKYGADELFPEHSGVKDNELSLIYDNDIVTDNAEFVQSERFLADRSPGLGMIRYESGKKPAEETKLSPDCVFVADTMGSVCRISEKTWEIQWASPSEEASWGEVKVYFRNGELVRAYDRFPAKVEYIGIGNGAAEESVPLMLSEKQSEDIRIRTADRDHAMAFDTSVSGEQNWLYLKRDEEGFVISDEKKEHSSSIFYTGDIRKIGDGYYLFSYIDLELENNITMTRFDNDLKKELWHKELKGLYDRSHTHFYYLSAEKTGNYTDMIVSVIGGNISLMEADTGKTVKSYSFENDLSEAYCSENGLLFIIFNNSKEYAVLMRNIADDQQENYNVVREQHRFVTGTELCGYCDNTYVTVANSSNIAYVYKEQPNPDCEDILSGYIEDGFHVGTAAVSSDGKYIAAEMSSTVDGEEINKMILFDTERKKRIETPYDEGFDLYGADFFDNGNVLLYLHKDMDRRLAVYSCTEGKTLNEITPPENKIFDFDSFHPSADGSSIYCFQSGRPKQFMLIYPDGRAETPLDIELPGYDFTYGYYGSYLLSPDNSMLALFPQSSEDYSTRLAVISPAEKKITAMRLEDMSVSADEIRTVFFTGARELCAVTIDGRAGCFDAKTGSLKWQTTAKGISALVYCAVNVDDKRFAILGNDGKLYLMTKDGYTGDSLELPYDLEYFADILTADSTVCLDADSRLINEDTLLLTLNGTMWLIDLDRFAVRFNKDNHFIGVCGERVFSFNRFDSSVISFPLYTTDELIRKARDYLSTFGS